MGGRALHHQSGVSTILTTLFQVAVAMKRIKFYFLD